MLPNTLKGFTLVADGFGYFGKLNSGQLPKLTVKGEDFRDGGMDGTVELDMGLDKMEARFGFAEYVPEALSLFGLLSGTKSITLTGSMEDEEGETIPIVGKMRGTIKESDPGDWTAGGGKSELKLMQAVRFYQLTVDGEEVYYIDVENCIRRINGVDQLAARRQNLGV